jgi:hypothetical protein
MKCFSFLVSCLVLGLVLQGCATSDSSTKERFFSNINTSFKPTNDLTITLNVGDSSRSKKLQIKDVINPIYLPEGRDVIEESIGIKGQSALLVHKMDASGRIYDQIINYDGDVLLELKPTIRVKHPTLREPWRSAWYEIIDAEKGYVLPLNWKNSGLNPGEQKVRDSLIGFQFLIHRKGFVPGTPKKDGIANEQILKAYGQIGPPMNWANVQWMGLHWKTPEGLRWSTAITEDRTIPAQLVNNSPGLVAIHVIDQNLSVTEKVRNKYTAAEARNFKFDGSIPYFETPAIAVLLERADGKSNLYLMGAGEGKVEHLKELPTVDFVLAKKIIDEREEKRKAFSSTLVSFEEAQPSIKASNEAYKKATHAQLVSKMGECYVTIHSKHFPPNGTIAKKAYAQSLEAARKCPDKKSYHNILLIVAEKEPRLLTPDEMQTLADTTSEDKLRNKMLALKEQVRVEKKNAAQAEIARQREELNRPKTYERSGGGSGSSSAMSYGLGNASRERYQQSVQGTERRNAERLRNDQLQKSLNRIGK